MKPSQAQSYWPSNTEDDSSNNRSCDATKEFLLHPGELTWSVLCQRAQLSLRARSGFAVKARAHHHPVAVQQQPRRTKPATAITMSTLDPLKPVNRTVRFKVDPNKEDQKSLARKVKVVSGWGGKLCLPLVVVC